MNKKKLKLESLKVKSFFTMSTEEKDRVKAGLWEMTYETDCDLSCLEECTDNGYYSIEMACYTDGCQGGTGSCGCTEQSADMGICEW